MSFNLPFSVRIAGADPVDGDRYLQPDIPGRDSLVLQGRAHDGVLCYVQSDKTLYIYDAALDSWSAVGSGGGSFWNTSGTTNLIGNVIVNTSSGGNLTLGDGVGFREYLFSDNNVHNIGLYTSNAGFTVTSTVLVGQGIIDLRTNNSFPESAIQLTGSSWRIGYFTGSLAGALIEKSPLPNTGIQIIDDNEGIGLRYAADYSTNGISLFGDRWIPDKGYVDLVAGAGGSIPTDADKELTPAVTSGDNQTTTLTISATPLGYVKVEVNGIGAVVGDGVLTKECYFSDDGGTTAKAISAIASGDTLYWNGVVASFDLAATDRIDLFYNV